jgi:hypothetical protein
MRPLCRSLKLQPFHSTLHYSQQLSEIGTRQVNQANYLYTSDFTCILLFLNKIKLEPKLSLKNNSNWNYAKPHSAIVHL